ncbi:TPA: hypothetical protein ACG3J2_002592, partial [Legionella pneumophila]
MTDFFVMYRGKQSKNIAIFGFFCYKTALVFHIWLFFTTNARQNKHHCSALVRAVKIFFILE